MIVASVVFFVLGIACLGLGLSGLAGLSFETGRALMHLLVGLALVAFLGFLATGRRSGPRT